ncbi:TPA: arsenic metallochaperone ArsD family protein [Listeria monocytogenes]
MKESGVEGLPLTLVDGQVYLEGKYPTIEQIRELTGLKLEDIK